MINEFPNFRNMGSLKSVPENFNDKSLEKLFDISDFTAMTYEEQCRVHAVFGYMRQKTLNTRFSVNGKGPEVRIAEREKLAFQSGARLTFGRDEQLGVTE